MLKKPSARRRSSGTHEVELPLVPIMDAFVTLIAFLLLATSMLAVTLIDTPVPVVSTFPDDPNKKDRPLSITLEVEQDGLVLHSLNNRFPEAKFPKVDLNYDLAKLHETLVALRKQFPTEKNITINPAPDIKYNDIIGIMDAVRLYLKTDETLFVKDEQGIDRADPLLFPNALFGNVLSGSNRK